MRNISVNGPNVQRDRNIFTSICLKPVFAKPNSILANVDTAKSSGISAANSGSLSRAFHILALSGMFPAKFVVIWSISTDDNYASLTCLCPFQCNKERETSSTLGIVHPPRYHAWDTQVMILQSSVHPSNKNVLWPAFVGGEATKFAIKPIDGTSEPTSIAMEVTKIWYRLLFLQGYGPQNQPD